jgi:hypothetical protein
MSLSDFFIDDNWEVDSPNMYTTEIVSLFVSEKKPKTFVELGTGKDASYASSICSSMKDFEEKMFISYELCKDNYSSAVEKLKEFDSFSKIHCDDMFNFFDQYQNFIPDMYMLDAGDEKLWSNQNNVGDWEIKGKNYGEESFFGKGKSENLEFFLKIQNERSEKGTFVILDDFLYGRGTYIADYFLSNADECDSNWEILNIFVGHGGSSICLLEKK